MTPEAERAIRNDMEHALALAEYEAFFDAEPKAGTAEASRFERLGLLMAAYEHQRWPVDAV